MPSCVVFMLFVCLFVDWLKGETLDFFGLRLLRGVFVCNGAARHGGPQGTINVHGRGVHGFCLFCVVCLKRATLDFFALRLLPCVCVCNGAARHRGPQGTINVCLWRSC